VGKRLDSGFVSPYSGGEQKAKDGSPNMSLTSPSSLSSSSSTTSCGLAGFAYPHWNGTLYPAHRPSSFQPLTFLADYFDVVEVNASFYQPLRPEVSKLWVRQVAHRPRFRFTAKLQREFTHERRLEPELVERFHEGMRPLAEAGRLGCLLMQFPWSFKFTAENRRFFIELRRAFHAYPLVAEMRHASWSCEEALGTFMDYHVGFAHIDQPAGMNAMPPTQYLTSPIGYVRLHGRNPASRWNDEARTGAAAVKGDYLYTTAELAEWKQRIQRLRSFAREVYVVFNNDARAQSAVNALQMRGMMEPALPKAPASLYRHYRPELHAWVQGPRQRLLFAA
jgi:uncharacterized protein YecE (DUF72 family)